MVRERLQTTDNLRDRSFDVSISRNRAGTVPLVAGAVMLVLGCSLTFVLSRQMTWQRKQR